MEAMTGKQLFEFIINTDYPHPTPKDHFETYLDDRYDFTVMAANLEAYVQQRIAGSSQPPVKLTTQETIIEQIAADEWAKASPYDTVGVVRARIRKAAVERINTDL